MEKLTIDRLVTVAVDIQNDFCPGGALAVTDGDQVIDPLNRLTAYTRGHNGIVIATGDQHPETTPHFETWPVHCVAGTHGAAFHENLQFDRDDIIINKGMGQTDGYSGFEGTANRGLTIEQLVTPKNRERVAVAIGGLATDYCVLNTVLDALKLHPTDGELHIFVPTDAVRAVNLQPHDGDEALLKMQAAGATLTTILEILKGEAFRFAK